MPGWQSAARSTPFNFALRARVPICAYKLPAQCQDMCVCTCRLRHGNTRQGLRWTLLPTCRQLAEGWAGVLTDWAAMGSLPADQAAKYQPAVVPDSAPIEERLQQSVSAVAVALSSMLPTMDVSILSTFTQLCWVQRVCAAALFCSHKDSSLAESKKSLVHWVQSLLLGKHLGMHAKIAVWVSHFRPMRLKWKLTLSLQAHAVQRDLKS